MLTRLPPPMAMETFGNKAMNIEQIKWDKLMAHVVTEIFSKLDATVLCGYPYENWWENIT